MDGYVVNVVVVVIAVVILYFLGYWHGGHDAKTKKHG